MMRCPDGCCSFEAARGTGSKGLTCVAFEFDEKYTIHPCLGDQKLFLENLMWANEEDRLADFHSEGFYIPVHAKYAIWMEVQSTRS